MTNKSQQLLTVYGKIITDGLRKKGWKQKEYLSAGVVALSRLTADEQLKCKELAYSKENDVEKIVEWKRLLEEVKKACQEDEIYYAFRQMLDSATPVSRARAHAKDNKRNPALDSAKGA